MIKTIKDEQKALKRLYKETTDPVLQIHLIAFGKSLNEQVEQGNILLFDNLNSEDNMKKVTENIDFNKLNNWLLQNGYL